MKTTFEIQKGTIVFEEERICINDKVYKRDRYITLALALASVAFGLMTLIHYMATGGKSEFSFTVFGVLIIAVVPAVIYQCRMDYSPSLKYDEVEKVIIRENPLGLLLADFVMLNKRKRHVVLDMNNECHFNSTTLPEFINTLNQKNIATVIR